jgi:hypothetical protein
VTVPHMRLLSLLRLLLPRDCSRTNMACICSPAAGVYSPDVIVNVGCLEVPTGQVGLSDRVLAAT